MPACVNACLCECLRERPCRCFKFASTLTHFSPLNIKTNTSCSSFSPCPVGVEVLVGVDVCVGACVDARVGTCVNAGVNVCVGTGLQGMPPGLGVH